MWNLPSLGLNLCLLHWQVDSLPQSHQTVVAPRKPPVPPRKPLGGALDDLLTLILRAYSQKFRKQKLLVNKIKISFPSSFLLQQKPLCNILPLWNFWPCVIYQFHVPTFLNLFIPSLPSARLSGMSTPALSIGYHCLQASRSHPRVCLIPWGPCQDVKSAILRKCLPSQLLLSCLGALIYQPLG